MAACTYGRRLSPATVWFAGQQATPQVHVCPNAATMAGDDHHPAGPRGAALIADTEAEILRPRRRPRRVDPRACTRWSATTSASTVGAAAAASGCGPLLGLLAYASITGDYERALPGAAAVELGHNFSLVHDDIEDGDRERRHRPTAVGGPRRRPGDQHRRHALQPVADGPPPPDRPRLQRREGPPPDAPVRRDLPRPVRGPVHRHRDDRARRR